MNARASFRVTQLHTVIDWQRGIDRRMPRWASRRTKHADHKPQPLTFRDREGDISKQRSRPVGLREIVRIQ